MKLIFAGGYGEHGRNCFYLQGSACAVMVDCGKMQGAEDCWPHLSREQIERCRYLLVTHSHADHVGALNWLWGNGFSGTVVLSKETYAQMSVKPEQYLLIDQLCKPETAYQISPALELQWGRSGHCPGAVWYGVSFEGKRVFFSGDYTECSGTYPCDAVRNFSADAAVVDCAYGPGDGSDEQLRERFREELRKTLIAGQSAILPVPKFGRGLEMAMSIEELAPGVPVFADAQQIQQQERLTQASIWVSGEARERLAAMPLDMVPAKAVTAPAVYLLSDPQLNLPKNQMWIEQNPGCAVFLTGHADEGTYSMELLHSGRARSVCFPVHQGNRECHELCRENDFRQVFKVHSAEWEGIAEAEI